MADIVKPLKIENPATGGTQLDIFPTEVNPAQDYIAAKGVSLEALSTVLIDKATATNEIQFTDAVAGVRTVNNLRTASLNSFNNSTNNFTATNVQTAIEEARRVPNQYLSSVTTVTTSSATFTTIATTTVSPPIPGTYVAVFCPTVRTTGASLTGEIILIKNSTQIADSLRVVGCSIALLGIITVSTNTVTVPAATMTRVSLLSTDTISAQFRSTSGGTLAVDVRSIELIRVGD